MYIDLLYLFGEDLLILKISHTLSAHRIKHLQINSLFKKLIRLNTFNLV